MHTLNPSKFSVLRTAFEVGGREFAAKIAGMSASRRAAAVRSALGVDSSARIVTVDASGVVIDVARDVPTEGDRERSRAQASRP